MDGYVGFHASMRHGYARFITDISKQCKKLVQHHLDSVTSVYSEVYYENEFQVGFSSTASFSRLNPTSVSSSLFLELSEAAAGQSDDPMTDQENVPPEKSNQHITPGKDGEALHESQITIPETPSPDQPCDMNYKVVKKENGNGVEVGPRKRISRIAGNNSRQGAYIRVHNGSSLFGDSDCGSRSSSAYSEICLLAARHFGRIREVLVERSVTSTLNSGFLTPW